MADDYTIIYGGEANQARTTFDEQMALNQLDTEETVKVAYVAQSNFVPRTQPVVIDGYGTRIPAYGTLTASYHTPGVTVDGQSDVGNANVRYGYLDDRLICHIATDEFDMNQRSSIQFMPARKRGMGVAIAKADEEQCAIATILTARASATVSGGPTGGSVSAALAGSSASALIALAWAAKTQMDNNHIEETGRYLGMSPARFNLIASQLLYLSDRNLGNDGSHTGRIAIPDIAGFEPFKSSHMSSANISSGTTGQRNSYIGDFRQTIAIAFQKEASLTLIPQANLPMGGKGNSGITSNAQPTSPIDVRTIEDKRAFAHINIASLITGHCPSDPPRAVELKDSSL